MATQHAVEYPQAVPADDIRVLIGAVTGAGQSSEPISVIAQSAWCVQGYAMSLLISEDAVPRTTREQLVEDPPGATAQNVETTLRGMLPAEDGGEDGRKGPSSVFLRMLIDWITAWIKNNLPADA